METLRGLFLAGNCDDAQVIGQQSGRIELKQGAGKVSGLIDRLSRQK